MFTCHVGSVLQLILHTQPLLTKLADLALHTSISYMFLNYSAVLKHLMEILATGHIPLRHGKNDAVLFSRSYWTPILLELRQKSPFGKVKANDLFGHKNIGDPLEYFDTFFTELSSGIFQDIVTTFVIAPVNCPNIRNFLRFYYKTDNNSYRQGYEGNNPLVLTLNFQRNNGFDDDVEKRKRKSEVTSSFPVQDLFSGPFTFNETTYELVNVLYIIDAGMEPGKVDDTAAADFCLRKRFPSKVIIKHYCLLHKAGTDWYIFDDLSGRRTALKIEMNAKFQTGTFLMTYLDAGQL